MNNVISFVTANFIAREAGYHLAAGWDEGQQAIEAFFRPAATFERRFDEMLTEICEMGFQAVDVWTGHLSPAWATPEQVTQARVAIERHGMRLVSVAGYFGATPDEFAPVCRLAADLGAPLLGGVAPVLGTHRDQVVSLLESSGLRLATENHRERSAAELLAALGPAPLTGACVDTGSFATRGCDAAAAIEELGERVIHVHFRDVTPTGTDESLAFGEGCVPLAACVAALRHLNYSGAISVEHEPEDRPPHADCRTSLRLLRSWLA